LKTPSLLLLACVLALPVFTEQTTKPSPPAALEMPVTKAMVSGPFIVKEGAISQPP